MRRTDLPRPVLQKFRLGDMFELFSGVDYELIGVFLRLRHDINQLNRKIEKVSDDLNVRIGKLNENYTAMSEFLSWMRGRMGFAEQSQSNAE